VELTVGAPRRSFPLRYGAEAPIIIVEGKTITAA